MPYQTQGKSGDDPHQAEIEDEDQNVQQVATVLRREEDFMNCFGVQRASEKSNVASSDVRTEASPFSST